MVDERRARLVEAIAWHRLGLPGGMASMYRRRVVAGEMTERELSRWAHAQFHHQSESELLNELALLDDDYDDADLGITAREPIEARIREIAAEILEAG